MVLRGCPRPDGFPRLGGTPVPTALLDRDGVLNIDRGYVSRREDFVWTDGALAALGRLKRLGYRLVVVTNQSGIGRGYYSEDEFLELTAWIHAETPLDLTLYCPHSPEANCPARKPGTGMLDAADAIWPIDREKSFLIGDKARDLESAEAFGVARFLFSGGDLDVFLSDQVL